MLLENLNLLDTVTNLLFLSTNYNIQWKECPCMKGVRLEDVTPELEEKALNEIKNNN